MNRRNFVFPSHYVGQYLAYDALKHVLSQSEHKDKVSKDTLTFSRNHSYAEIEQARAEVGNRFRAKHNIDPEATVVFFAPGDTVKEYEYSFEAFRRGYEDFVLKNSYPTSLSHYAAPRDNFKLVISTNSASRAAEWFKTHFDSSEWPTEVILVTEQENQHFDAMCVLN